MPTTDSFYKSLPDDVLDAIAQIYIDCFTGPPRFETWTFEQAREHILKFVEAGADIVVVRETDGTIAAFGIGLPLKDYFNKNELIAQGASESSYYFAELATRPVARNQGYGSLLHKKRIAIAKQRGYDKLSVRAREDNKVIIRMLTEKLGFKKVGEYVSSIKNSRSVRLIMEMDI
jgi:ribosomal protein S18 acetylase RimI-like enzyme